MMLRRHREAREVPEEAPEGEGPGTEATAPSKDDAPPKSAGRSSARSKAKKEG